MPAASRAFRGSCFAIAASPALDLSGTGEEVPSRHRDDDGDDDYPDNRAIATLRCDLDFGHPLSELVHFDLAHSSCRDSIWAFPTTITYHPAPIACLQLPDALACLADRRHPARRASAGNHAIQGSEGARAPSHAVAVSRMSRARR